LCGRWGFEGREEPTYTLVEHVVSKLNLYPHFDFIALAILKNGKKQFRDLFREIHRTCALVELAGKSGLVAFARP
jgi:hypothetical protein